MMNVIDLFSGAGGLSEGFRNDFFNILAHVEMDTHATYTLKTREAFHYLKDNKYLEIYNNYLQNYISREELYNYIPSNILNRVIQSEISEETIEDIFVKIDNMIGNKKIHAIIGGPPCQAYSTIGRAKNKDKKDIDERIYLYEYYGEFLKKYDPIFFLFENVKGLLSFKDEYDELLLPKILKYFKSLGYKLEYMVINSSDYGVSQKRERVFIYGEKQNQDNRKNESFFKQLSKFKEKPDTIKKLFDDLPIMSDNETNNKYSKQKLGFYRKYNLALSQNIARKHNDRDKEIYKIVCRARRNGKQLKYTDLPSNLQSHNNKTSFLDRYKAIDGNDLSHTVVAHISKDGNYYIHPDLNQNRSISVREAARIQGFSDDYYFESNRTSAFKQIGNAVPPILSQKLSKTIYNMFKNTF